MLTLINKLKYSSYYKIFFALLIQSACCFLLTSQQFHFDEFGPGFRRRFDNFRSFNFGSSPTNSASKLKNGKWLKPGQELIFGTTTSRPSTAAAAVIVNNRATTPTLVPFIPRATTSTPQFLNCFTKCPTTSEHNPVCASNREVYGNEQKFDCARRCGADIQIVRRGSCEGLFPMSRG